MGLYYALYLPAIVESQIDYDQTVKFYVSPITRIIFYGNSICNPLVYVWQNQHFRVAFVTILNLPLRNEQSLTQPTSDFNPAHNTSCPPQQISEN